LLNSPNSRDRGRDPVKVGPVKGGPVKDGPVKDDPARGDPVDSVNSCRS
jgi:hypothetical protein